VQTEPKAAILGENSRKRRPVQALAEREFEPRQPGTGFLERGLPGAPDAAGRLHTLRIPKGCAHSDRHGRGAFAAKARGIMNIHLYFMCYRNEALIASQLEPEAFGRYMAVGTSKHTRGSVMFFEVDRSKLDSSFFQLANLEERCRRADGNPKRSKYVSIYRVLEHLPVAALGKLHLVTGDGRSLAIEPAQYDAKETDSTFLYQQLCPVSPMVVSSLAPKRMVSFMTDPENPLCVPRLFFADLLLDFDESGQIAGYLPYEDPLHLADCVHELRVPGREKETKTVSRSSQIQAFYRTINRGFFVGDQTDLKFYPFPDRRDLEVKFARWWRSAETRF
jgi:hypothetical protein